MSEDRSLSFSEYQWCLDEFADVELKRRTAKSSLWRVGGATGDAAYSEPINHACEDWADTKAAYRFFDNKKVTAEELLKPHQQRTVSRMAEHPVVLAVQDTSFLTHGPSEDRRIGCYWQQGPKATGVSACILRWLWCQRACHWVY